MTKLRKAALFGAALLAVVGISQAADMIFSMGDKFSPLGPMVPTGEDLNVIVDRVNGISAGTYTVTDLNVSDDAAIGDDLAVTGLATVGETLGVTGVTTPTGGVGQAGGFTASCRNVAVGGTQAVLAADGNNSTPVITEQYVSEIFVPTNCTVTGIALFNGSDVTGNVLVGIGNTAGAVLGTSAATAGSGTDAYQRVPLTAPLALKGPATYYILTQYSSATARYNTFAVGNFGCVADTGNTFGTLTSFTAPTTFATAICNIASLY